MKVQTANINYKDSDLLKDVVKWYNHSHRNSTRSCELILGENFNHHIKVTDKSDLIPYGIYDIGTQIGYMEMKNNFRIRLGKWFKIVDKVIYNAEVPPKDETFATKLDMEETQTLPIRMAIGINSSFGTLQQYLVEPDIKRLELQSNLHKISPSMFQTQNKKRVNYSIWGNYLFLFGTELRFGENYYEIELDSVYEIEIPSDDF